MMTEEGGGLWLRRKGDIELAMIMIRVGNDRVGNDYDRVGNDRVGKDFENLYDQLECMEKGKFGAILVMM